VILIKQAIILVNIGFSEYNRAEPKLRQNVNYITLSRFVAGSSCPGSCRLSVSYTQLFCATVFSAPAPWLIFRYCCLSCRNLRHSKTIVARVARSIEPKRAPTEALTATVLFLGQDVVIWEEEESPVTVAAQEAAKEVGCVAEDVVCKTRLRLAWKVLPVQQLVSTDETNALQQNSPLSQGVITKYLVPALC
jgi:hypothetical protein